MDRSTREDDLPPAVQESRKKRLRVKIKSTIKRLFPVITWLPTYKWKSDFVYDLIAGLTIACVSVPQSLAFALLAHVDLIYGLNTACFSALIYTLFGTATISAFGPVAIGSMLSGESISKIDFETAGFSKEEYAAALTIAIGVFYLIMFALRLGVLTVIFKKPFVSGFIMACALHILVKSFRQLLGIHTHPYYGNFNFFYNTIAIFSKLGETHIPTLIISVVVMIIFYGNMLFLSPFVVKRYPKVVIPIDTIVMGGAILFSYWFKFSELGVDVVGPIPTGLPKLITPTLDAFWIAFPEAIAIALINYATTTTMTLLFNPDLDREQDILAMGLSNIICGNLQCITIGNSMMRTMIAINLGIKTLFSSMLSALFLLLIILFAGPLFQPLPISILGCIIMTAVSKLLYQRIQDMIKFSKSFEDLFIFFGTFIATLAVDVSFGLVVGVVLSLRNILDGVAREEKAQREEEKKKTEEENQLVEKNNV